AAADAAAATGTSVDQASAAMTRIALSGQVAARQLSTLGLSTQDMAQQLGLSLDASAKEISAAFKEMDPTDRLATIEAALQKYQGVASQVAQGIAGEWQNFKTQWEFALEEIGKAISPVAEGVLSFSGDVLKSSRDAATAFADMSTSIKGVFSDLAASAHSAWSAILPDDV